MSANLVYEAGIQAERARVMKLLNRRMETLKARFPIDEKRGDSRAQVAFDYGYHQAIAETVSVLWLIEAGIDG